MDYQINISDELIISTMQGVINNFLVPRFIELGMNATGSWINALEPRITNGNGEIWGFDYTYFLANGRKPGKQPPVSALIPWVNAKFGIGGQQAVSIAWAVSKKIQKEGTNYYPEGTDLLTVLESNEVKNYIYSRIQQGVTAQVTAILKKQLNDNFS